MITRAGTAQVMLRLAIPVLLEQLLGVMVGYVDMALAGHVLKEESFIAAMGSLAYLMWLLFSLFAAVAIGATAVISRSVGGGYPRQAALAANQALLLGIVFAAPIALLYGLGGTTLAGWLQLSGVSAEHAGRYLAIVALSVPLIAIETVGIAALRGAGDTVTGLVAMAIVNVINMALSFVLVTGWGPFPNLGWDGLAIGTAVAHAVGGLIILRSLLAGRAGLPLRLKMLWPKRRMIARLLRIGVPGGMDSLSILFCHLWYLSIINAIGPTAAAAHGLGIRIESLAYLPGTAFQVAAATMAGQYLGAGDPQRARRGVWLALLTGGGIISVTGLLFAFQGALFTWMFLGANDSGVAQLTEQLLKIVAVSLPSLSVAMILTGALRGAGDTRWPLAITFVCYLLIRIPGAYFLAWESVPIPLTDIVLPAANLGVRGAWCAMVIETIVRSGLLLARFKQGGWTRVRV